MTDEQRKLLATAEAVNIRATLFNHTISVDSYRNEADRVNKVTVFILTGDETIFGTGDAEIADAAREFAKKVNG